MAEAPVLVQAWAHSAPTLAVMRALAAAGGEGCARFVGGCVRNALLGQAVSDIDIATSLTPDQVSGALTAAGLRWVPTGIEHGTITAIAQGHPYEITTLRRDVSTDGRRAVVAFTSDWAEDAARRDFRLNALYMDAHGQVFDPLGDGVADAQAGRIVFVGDPMTRIREDYLRILRFFRFLAWYGRGEPDRAAVTACVALKDMLTDRPGERVAKELLKLLGADDPRETVRLMHWTGVLDVVAPVAGLDLFAALVGVERDDLGEADADLRLAAILRPAEAAVAATRLRLSNAQRDRVLAATAATPRVDAAMSPKALRAAIYAADGRTLRDRIKLAWAADPGSKPAWRALMALAETWSPPVFPVTGDDAIAAGVARGPLMGQALKRVEAWWVDQDFRPDRSAALAKLGRVAASLGQG